jgi:hypothetical protein
MSPRRHGEVHPGRPPNNGVLSLGSWLIRGTIILCPNSVSVTMNLERFNRHHLQATNGLHVCMKRSGLLSYAHWSQKPGKLVQDGLPASAGGGEFTSCLVIDSVSCITWRSGIQPAFLEPAPLR